MESHQLQTHNMINGLKASRRAGARVRSGVFARSVRDHAVLVDALVDPSEHLAAPMCMDV